MEAFYLRNVTKYHSLVNALDPMRKPRATSGEAGPNMVVSVRIRPLSNEEGFPCAVFPRTIQENVLDIHDMYNHPRGIPILKSFDYQVDRIFNSESTTEEIYDNLVASLVPFAWNGGIGTLFAYGQTGSGKTFTISKLQQLVASALMQGGHEDTREVYMTIIDLAGNSAFDLLNERMPISLLEDSFGVTHMVGANEIQVCNKEEMSDLIELAACYRRTEPTLKNDASSLSHAICRIRIRDTSNNSDGLLYLIDLAGSEGARDVAKHGADRMRETREINISLSVLKECIRGKAQADAINSSSKTKSDMRMPHIPSRQSSLTKVLKHVFEPSSSRECRTIVIACVNPSLADVGASKNTMRFAEMLRVTIPGIEIMNVNPMAPMSWNNTQLREWIAENSGTPSMVPSVLAPRESGSQLLNLSNIEFEYRCQKCPGVRVEQARALRSKLWQLHIDSQHAAKPPEKKIRPVTPSEARSVPEFTKSTSSRSLDPDNSNLHFKDRLRSGMVVKYAIPREDSMNSDKAEDFKLAVLLCPSEGMQEKETKAAVINRRVHGHASEAKNVANRCGQYTCALLTPGRTHDAYELNIWMQIAIDIEFMSEEVHMEYEVATRYYYLSV